MKESQPERVTSAVHSREMEVGSCLVLDDFYGDWLVARNERRLHEDIVDLGR